MSLPFFVTHNKQFFMGVVGDQGNIGILCVLIIQRHSWQVEQAKQRWIVDMFFNPGRAGSGNHVGVVILPPICKRVMTKMNEAEEEGGGGGI